ncbi:MAG: hypothetical protein FGM40_04620 [Rhodocyclaceae bacterium]|nr:hypothetical protein [Rhodocyclaceae bacterium]
MNSHLPLILVEGVLVFGGVLAFAWWQFRDLRLEREKSARAAEREKAGAATPDDRRGEAQ